MSASAGDSSWRSAVRCRILSSERLAWAAYVRGAYAPTDRPPDNHAPGARFGDASWVDRFGRPRMPLVARLGAAIALQLLVPTLTVAFRMRQARRPLHVPLSVFLY